MQTTMQRARAAWLGMTLDFSKIAKEIAMVTGVFVEGRRRSYFILAIDKSKEDHKNLRSKVN